ncbi:hypothetical protein [Aureimonas populi]|uniref:Uncharacterized protein n=1 Tax=Aureimonas populi TaxID=1701758 RepID=A0ABW5CLZ2_9HYPH|nr:hypothetical protein [Aureimonas populi]
MKKLILALAASGAILGAAHAQTPPPGTTTDQELDATTVPAEEAAPMTSTDAPQSGEASPSDPDQIQDATTAEPRIVPLEEGEDAPAATEDSPTAPDQEQDATTVN